MQRTAIATPQAPAAIGPYSQAVRIGNLVFTSGQIPLDPATGQLVTGDLTAETRRVLDNLAAVLDAAGASFDDVAKTTIFLTDLADFAKVNEIMGRYFQQPYPARAAIGVAALPRGAQVEMDGILVLS